MTPSEVWSWGFEVWKCLVQAWGHNLLVVTISMSFFSLHQAGIRAETGNVSSWMCVHAPNCVHLSRSPASPPPFLQPCHWYSILGQPCPSPRFYLLGHTAFLLHNQPFFFCTSPGPVPLFSPHSTFIEIYLTSLTFKSSLVLWQSYWKVKENLENRLMSLSWLTKLQF